MIPMQVYKEPSKRALDEQFGGEDKTPPPAPGFTSPTLKLTKYSNAYMLVYVRESSWKDIMLDVSQNDIAEHVRSRLKVTLLLVCFAEAHCYAKTQVVAGHLLVSHDSACSSTAEGCASCIIVKAQIPMLHEEGAAAHHAVASCCHQAGQSQPISMMHAGAACMIWLEDAGLVSTALTCIMQQRDGCCSNTVADDLGLWLMAG